MVAPTDEAGIIKSIGNSTTPPRDLVHNKDVKMTFWVLAESVAARLREHGFKCTRLFRYQLWIIS